MLPLHVKPHVEVPQAAFHLQSKPLQGVVVHRDGRQGRVSASGEVELFGHGGGPFLSSESARGRLGLEAAADDFAIFTPDTLSRFTVRVDGAKAAIAALHRLLSGCRKGLQPVQGRNRGNARNFAPYRHPEVR
jgi:hypothetical protein